MHRKVSRGGEMGDGNLYDVVIVLQFFVEYQKFENLLFSFV